MAWYVLKFRLFPKINAFYSVFHIICGAFQELKDCLVLLNQDSLNFNMILQIYIRRSEAKRTKQPKTCTYSRHATIRTH